MARRGIKQNNPGAIPVGVSRFMGEITDRTLMDGVRQGDIYRLPTHYKAFESIEMGYRAILLMLRNYGVLYGDNTIRSVVRRWYRGRSSVVSLSTYTRAIALRLGASIDHHLDTYDRDVMLPVVACITKLESGVEPQEEDLIAAWELFAGER